MAGHSEYFRLGKLMPGVSAVYREDSNQPGYSQYFKAEGLLSAS
jgi:hypothetical protein